jgi:hypothetical protein
MERDPDQRVRVYVLCEAGEAIDAALADWKPESLRFG